MTHPVHWSGRLWILTCWCHGNSFNENFTIIWRWVKNRLRLSHVVWMYLNTFFFVLMKRLTNPETIHESCRQSVTVLLMLMLLLLSVKISYYWNSSSLVISLEIKRIFGKKKYFTIVISQLNIGLLIKKKCSSWFSFIDLEQLLSGKSILL